MLALHMQHIHVHVLSLTGHSSRTWVGLVTVAMHSVLASVVETGAKVNNIYNVKNYMILLHVYNNIIYVQRHTLPC